MSSLKLETLRSFWRNRVAPFGLIQRVFVGLVVLNLLVIGLALWSISQSRVRYDGSAAVETRNVAQLLNQDITESIHSIDLSLQTLVFEAEARLRPGNRGVITDAISLGRLIAQLQFLAPDLAGLSVANAQGRVIQGASTSTPTSVSVAERDYFLKLRDQPGQGLVVSAPVVGKITGVWVINLARGIRRADGSFAGVVFASVPLSRFTRDYAALAAGPNDSFTLFDAELRVIVRSLGDKIEESVIGEKFNLPVLQALLASGRTEGSYTLVSAVDGVERVFFYRHIKGYPLGISVGRATQDYLAAWRIEVLKTVALTLLFVFSTLILFWFILRAWRLQLAAVDALNSANQTLLVEQNFSQAVFESSPFAMYVRDHKGFIKHWNPAAERLFGWREDEILGKTLPSVPADKIKESENFRLRVLNGESILQVETQRKKRDGTLFEMSNTSTPLRSAKRRKRKLSFWLIAMY
jgi:PAS domain S-box-containing protein